MDFLKLKNSENSCLLPLFIYTLFFYKSNFMRTKPLILERNNNEKKNKAKNKVRHAEHSKVSRLVILKIIRTKHQNRA